MFDQNKKMMLLFVICSTGCTPATDDSDTLITLTTVNTFNQDDTGDGDGDPTTAGDGDGDPTTAGDGDGDGDPTTAGDGDGEPGDGDPGDGDPGDGDPGDGDPGDGDPGDGDPGDGDGDGLSGADLCTPYSERIGECHDPAYVEGAYAQCTYIFDEVVGEDNPVCLPAWDNFINCHLGVSCEELPSDFFTLPPACEQAGMDLTNCNS